MAENAEPELQAIAALLKALGPLKENERANVIDFVFRKLGIEKSDYLLPQGSRLLEETSASDALRSFAAVGGPPAQAAAVGATDIRSLKQEKNPKTASQMVALIAYYLENVAPAKDRRDYITSADVTPYFKQGDFRLPSGPATMTLTNAKNAGYLNALGNGRYRLNPVGYNLVAHKLPDKGADKVGSPKTAAKRAKSSK